MPICLVGIGELPWSWLNQLTNKKVASSASSYCCWGTGGFSLHDSDCVLALPMMLIPWNPQNFVTKTTSTKSKSSKNQVSCSSIKCWWYKLWIINSLWYVLGIVLNYIASKPNSLTIQDSVNYLQSFIKSCLCLSQPCLVLVYFHFLHLIGF